MSSRTDEELMELVKSGVVRTVQPPRGVRRRADLSSAFGLVRFRRDDVLKVAR